MTLEGAARMRYAAGNARYTTVMETITRVSSGLATRPYDRKSTKQRQGESERDTHVRTYVCTHRRRLAAAEVWPQ